MSDEICIRITKSDRSTGRVQVTGTLSKPHRSARGLKMVPLRTSQATMKSPYVSELTPGLLAAIWDAVRAVTAGFYEDEMLPWD